MVNYVSVSMSLANDREGGILALMSLVKLKKNRPVIVVIRPVQCRADLRRQGDDPAISVLSALAGATTL